MVLFTYEKALVSGWLADPFSDTEGSKSLRHGLITDELITLTIQNLSEIVFKIKNKIKVYKLITTLTLRYSKTTPAARSRLFTTFVINICSLRRLWINFPTIFVFHIIFIKSFAPYVVYRFADKLPFLYINMVQTSFLESSHISTSIASSWL